MHLMLLTNGYDLASSAQEEINMTENIASGKMHESKIAQWLKQHSEKKTPKS